MSTYMGDAQGIDSELLSKALIRGGVVMYQTTDALLLVRKLKDANLEIFGIDAFAVIPESIQVADYIDYTSTYYREYDPDQYYSKFHVYKDADRGHWREAERFIKDRISTGYYFEITHDDGRRYT